MVDATGNSPQMHWLARLRRWCHASITRRAYPDNKILRDWARDGNSPPASWWNDDDDVFAPEISDG